MQSLYDKTIHWTISSLFIDKFIHFDITSVLDSIYVIKRSPVRTVASFIWQKEEYILKIFHYKGWDYIRKKIYPKHWIEWQNLQNLSHSKLAIPEVVAIGDGNTQGYLITKKISHSFSLKEICQKETIAFSERRHWAKELAFLVAQLHNSGYIHKDIHTGNILLDKEKKFYLIDLYEIKKVYFGKHYYLKNLAQLAFTFFKYSTASDCLFFLKEYLKFSVLFTNSNIMEIFQKIRYLFWDFYFSFMRKRSQRCLKDNKYFQIYKRNGFFAIGHKNQAETNQICQDFEYLKSIATVIKNSRSTLVFQTQYGIVKQYHRKMWHIFFKDLFRPSRAYRAWVNGYHCIIRNIPTAKPLFFAEKRWGCFTLSSYIVMEEIKPRLSLDKAIIQQQNLEKRLQILYQVGRLVRHLHQRGLTHRDLKSSNILIDDKDSIYIIDLDGLSVNNAPSKLRKEKDFQRLLRSVKNIPSIQEMDIQSLLAGYYLN